MLLSILSIAATILSAQEPDNGTTMQDSLCSITVIAGKGVIVSNRDTLAIRPGAAIEDILQQGTGLYLGDYGGAAGAKYVNLRGLGSAYTAIYIDGVRVGNIQNGQSDLTTIGIEQFGGAVIDYAQNSVSFTTSKPIFPDARPIAGQVSFNAGSFNSYNPYLRFDFKLGKKVSLSANAAGTFSKGDFKYCDSLRRTNNDISQWRAGIDLFGINSKGRWQAKAHFNSTDRGVAGSTYYPSDDRQKDRNVYIQGHIEENFTKLYALSASAKYAFDRMDYNSSWSDSRYDRQEVQINTTHRFTIIQWLDLTLAADFAWDKIASTEYDAQRYSPTLAAGAAFRIQRFSADIALEYDAHIDAGAKARNVLSPSVGLRYGIIKSLEINAFARRAYRMPSFNELNFVGYGNPDLRPEDAWLSGLGLNFNKAINHWKLNASADGFFNFLQDKIISAPTEADPNIWLPYNIGKVHSGGIDLAAGFGYGKTLWDISFNAKYSFQDAVDKTPGSASYGQQVPYIARHTVILDGSAGISGWKLSAIWNLRAGRRDAQGQLPDWNTIDVTASKTLKLRGCGPLTLYICGKNLGDCRYESVSGYPMPGISVTGGFDFKF